MDHNNNNNNYLPPKSQNSSKSLRILQFNVFGWKDSFYSSNFIKIHTLIKSLDVDIISLNEIDSNMEVAKQLADLLSYHIFGSAADAGLGNCILSRFPFISTKKIILRSDASVEMRVLIMGEIELINTNNTNNDFKPSTLRIYCTHLEDKYEDVRLHQLKVAAKYELDLNQNTEHILVGDFNSLCINDYTSETLEKIKNHRENNQREEPKSEVYKWLLERGYRDSLKEFKKLNKDNETENKIKEENEVNEEWKISRFDMKSTCYEHLKGISTCWANTRIDYLFLSKMLKAKVVNYQRIPVKLSDHYPICVDLQLFED